MRPPTTDEPRDAAEASCVKDVGAEAVNITTEEQRELDAAVDDSAAQFARGDYVEARAFALGLIAKA